MSKDISTTILGLGSEIMSRLAEEFPPEVFAKAPPAADGFEALIIPWTEVAARLDNVFGGGWSYEIIRIDYLPEMAVVQARITIQMLTIVNALAHRWDIRKDGIGSCVWSTVNGTLVNRGYNVAEASSNALKKAAVLLNVALKQLYGRRQLNVAPPAPTAAPTDNASQPAQAFQIRQVVKYFEGTCRIDRGVWMAAVGLQDLSHMNQALIAQILSGQHPYVRHLVSGQQAQPSGGIRTSNA